MKVLVIGSGGREHAIAWKLAQSSRLDKLYIAPGNPGTAASGENVPIAVEDIPRLVEFALGHQIDLVVVGPENALAAGLADKMWQAGIRVFGPTQSAARIESSKVFAKRFMAKYQIPTAPFEVFNTYGKALDYLVKVNYPVVIKVDGLAAGKGVILPDSEDEARKALQEILLEKTFGSAGMEVILEERLDGEEISLLAFTDGWSVVPMLPAQDHKRLLDHDQGPNTGGMGAYCPVQICPPHVVAEICRRVLQPAVDGLRAEGTPFIGVLYAGLMLTSKGVQVLEFNCRFGDPEAQPLLMMLDTDLLYVLDACVSQRLDRIDVRWKEGAAACVVLASEGYPAKPVTGRRISGLNNLPDGVLAFHAGTRQENGELVSAGGRVLGITARGETLASALEKTYQGLAAIHLEGGHYRKDIGKRGLEYQSSQSSTSAYASSGVNIDAGNRAVEMMSAAVRSTYTPEVLAGIGSFGGLYDASMIKTMENPVLVASTDGVGTKVKLAAQAESYETIGQDIVNHCINDILVQGAFPIFFLDYFATSRLNPAIVAEIVSGMSLACKQANCVLLGGETAEMPGVYLPDEFDVAGTIVGIVERRSILPRADLKAGDVLIGLRSSGPHTNGYSLIRNVLSGIPLTSMLEGMGISLGDALLEPHRSYLPLLRDVLSTWDHPVKALVHITGGGFVENIPRVLPDNLAAVVNTAAWQLPRLYQIIQQRGAISTSEMYRIFNMGIGMIAIVSPDRVDELQQKIPEETWIIGKLISGPRQVIIQ